jgi:hypothetical protein
METDAKYSIIDARTDQRWVRNVEMLVKGEEWNELWKLAQKTPPIWTVRILRHLNKRGWTPDPEEQLPFFQELSKFVVACNEYDLPGPDLRAPISMQIGTANLGIAAARVTADGEFVFVMDHKAAAIDVHRVSDLGVVERIRLDMIAGKQYVTLAFAINPDGTRLAVLSYEARSQRSFIHTYELSDGQVDSDKWLNLAHSNFGQQTSRLAFDTHGDRLALYSAMDLVTLFDVEKGVQLRQFENPSIDPTKYYQFARIVDKDSSHSDWSKHGRRAVADPSSRSLAFALDGGLVVAWRGMEAVVADAISGTARQRTVCWSGSFAVANNGLFMATLERFAVFLADLTTGTDQQIAHCRDPLARIAISEDSEFLAVAMSHSDVIMLWHIPDGRPLGSLPSLAHQALADFRFTSGGSVVAVTNSGLVQVWEADGNGNAWPWSRELVQITHQPVDSSSVEVLRQAQEMRRRGWLSHQESNLLDLALALMQNRLNLDIEVEWEGQLPGDIYDIEID